MRRQYFSYFVGVFGIVATIYGGYLLIYHLNHGNGFKVAPLIFLIAGLLALGFFIAAIISKYLADKKRKEEAQKEVILQAKQVSTEEKKVAAPAVEEKPIVKEEMKPRSVKKEYAERSASYSYNAPSTIYVKLVGYGPVLRIEGSRILDLRDNTYYQIEGNFVNRLGQGLCYEIRGSQIKDAFGGYLYEISGSNINKIFGGFYASISGNYITTYDLSKKYETTDSLSKKQILVLAALLF